MIKKKQKEQRCVWRDRAEDNSNKTTNALSASLSMGWYI
jgi:hypothetical protein